MVDTLEAKPRDGGRYWFSPPSGGELEWGVKSDSSITSRCGTSLLQVRTRQGSGSLNVSNRLGNAVSWLTTGYEMDFRRRFQNVTPVTVL